MYATICPFIFIKFTILERLKSTGEHKVLRRDLNADIQACQTFLHHV